MGIVNALRGFFSPSKSGKSIYSSSENSTHAYLKTGHEGGGEKYTGGLTMSGEAFTLDHEKLRLNSRRAYFDSTVVHGLIDRFCDTVSGSGLKLRAMPDKTILGISDESAFKWQEDVDSRFHLWASSRNQNRSESLSFLQAHRMYTLFQQRDNDVFIRLYYSSDPKLLNPLQFEFIDPDQIVADSFTNTYGSDKPRGWNSGIKFDARGRELAYRVVINRASPLGMAPRVITVPRYGAKSGYIFMLHGYIADYAGQIRGYPRISHILQEANNLSNFVLSYIAKAVSQSHLNVAVVPSKTAPASNLGGSLGSLGVGAPMDPIWEEKPRGGVNDIRHKRIPVKNLDTPGGLNIFGLMQGEDLKVLEGKTPSEAFPGFMDAFVKQVSSSVSMPSELLTMSFNTSYSASRAAFILYWRTVESLRDEMSIEFLKPVYNMWLGAEIASGRIRAPGWGDPSYKAAWSRCRFVGSPLPNIDPVKTARADSEYVKMGAQSFDDVAEAYNGSSSSDNMKVNEKRGKSNPFDFFGNRSRR